MATRLLFLIVLPLWGQTDWPTYGHHSRGQRHSPLSQITPQNVTRLERAWSVHTGGRQSEASSGREAYFTNQSHGYSMAYAGPTPLKDFENGNNGALVIAALAVRRRMWTTAGSRAAPQA